MDYIKKHEAVVRLASDMSRPKLDVAKEIQAMTNVLDRIAAKI